MASFNPYGAVPEALGRLTETVGQLGEQRGNRKLRLAQLGVETKKLELQDKAESVRAKLEQEKFKYETWKETLMTFQEMYDSPYTGRKTKNALDSFRANIAKYTDDANIDLKDVLTTPKAAMQTIQDFKNKKHAEEMQQKSFDKADEVRSKAEAEMLKQREDEIRKAHQTLIEAQMSNYAVEDTDTGQKTYMFDGKPVSAKKLRKFISESDASGSPMGILKSLYPEDWTAINGPLAPAGAGSTQKGQVAAQVAGGGQGVQPGSAPVSTTTQEPATPGTSPGEAKPAVVQGVALNIGDSAPASDEVIQSLQFGDIVDIGGREYRVERENNRNKLTPIPTGREKSAARGKEIAGYMRGRTAGSDGEAGTPITELPGKIAGAVSGTVKEVPGVVAGIASAIPTEAARADENLAKVGNALYKVFDIVRGRAENIPGEVIKAAKAVPGEVKSQASAVEHGARIAGSWANEAVVNAALEAPFVRKAVTTYKRQLKRRKKRGRDKERYDFLQTAKENLRKRLTKENVDPQDIDLVIEAVELALE